MVITLQPTIPFCPQADKIRAKSPQNLHRFALCFGPKKPLFSPTFAPKLAKTALNHGEKHQNLSLWEASGNSLRTLNGHNGHNGQALIVSVYIIPQPLALSQSKGRPSYISHQTSSLSLHPFRITIKMIWITKHHQSSNGNAPKYLSKSLWNRRSCTIRSCGPLAELCGPDAVDAITHADNGVKIVELG